MVVDVLQKATSIKHFRMQFKDINQASN